jgi:two-component system, cell cycle sensor histidine kinase and response regulator CckA
MPGECPALRVCPSSRFLHTEPVLSSTGVRGAPPALSGPIAANHAATRVLGAAAGCFLALAALGAPADPSLFAPVTSPAAFRFTEVTVDSGLPENFVRAVCQSADGHIWIGTTGGLVRHNASNLKLIDDRPLPSGRPPQEPDQIRCLLGARDGTLWIGSELRGLGWMRAGEFGVFEANDRLPGEIRALAEDRAGTLWIGTGEGVFTWDGRTLSALTPPGAERGALVNALLAEADGSMIVGWSRAAPQRWNGSAFLPVFPDAPTAPPAGVRALARDGRGDLWCGSFSGGLTRLGTDGTVTHLPDPPGIASGAVVRALFRDREGRLFAGTTRGLFVLVDSTFTRVTGSGMPVTSDVHQIHQDAEGSLWVATNRGALHLSGPSFRVIDSRNGLASEKVRCVLPDSRGTLWVGTDSGGLHRMLGGEVRSVPLRGPRPAEEPTVFSLTELAPDRILVGTASGAYVACGENAEPAPVAWNVADFAIRAAVRDRAGDLWIGGEGLGLIRLAADGRRHAVIDPGDGPAGSVRALLEDASGGLWVGTDAGLLHLAPAGRRVFRQSDGLPNDAVQALYQTADGAIWIGTARGLARWKDGRLQAWRSADGLRDERIFSLVDDGRGNLWLGCPAGIYRIPLAELESQAGSRAYPVGSAVFGSRHGLVGGVFHGGAQPASARDAAGQLLFPSPAGLVVIDPRLLTVDTQEPPVVIERVEYRNSRVRLRDGVYVVGPARGALEIKFSALSFKDSSQNIFRYRLEGVDPEWVSVRGRRSTLYTNLAPGTYQFQVIASNSDGVWNRDGATALIRVLPLYHQTLWFRTLLGAGVAGLLGGSVWLRLRRLRLRQALLARTVEERTADLRREIDQRLAAEAGLRKSAELLSRAFRASPVPLMLCRLDDGRIVEANPGLAALMDRPLAEVLGHPERELGFWPPDPFRESLLAEIRAGRAVRNRELVLARKGGPRNLLLSSEAFDLPSGPHVLHVILDITDRAALENQLRQLQKIEAVGTLAAGIAHDFNNLLTVIRGHVALLIEGASAGEAERESLAHIGAAADRAARLTQQLLAYSRQQHLDVRAFALNALVVRVTVLLRPVMGETIRIVHRLGSGLPLAMGDEHQIEQVVVNMAVNARDAMPRGGELRLLTEVIAVGPAALARNPEARAGHFLRLTVEDTGTGIDPALLPRIFEPFFTTKEVGRGTGLGLATAFGIVKQHQGWIEVRSEQGRGSAFEIYLPVVETPAGVREAPASAPADSPSRDACILLAEDEPTVRKLIRRVLEREGYALLVAATGPEALELAQATPGRIDVLLTDFIMPDGLTGLELAEILRRNRPDVKVIVCTGYSPDLIAPGTPAGVAVLRKPFSPAELLDAVRTALAPPPAPSAG